MHPVSQKRLRDNIFLPHLKPKNNDDRETDNKPSMSNDGLANTLLAIYELNYKTNKRKFIKCEWIETQ